MKFDVYGKKIEVTKDSGKWVVFLLGTDGKKRISHDIFIPSSVSEDEVESWLEDLLHEFASPD